MQLENSFTVPATPDVAWDVLLDVERVAPCMPGATLTERDGDTFAGTVKVKVGPIAMTYKGTAAFAERDDATHTVHIDAKGRETRGSGTANAKIICRLTADGEGTRVDVTTDLAITGRPTQFGRGVMAEVAGKVVTQFATALAEEIGSGPSAPAAPPAAPEPRSVTGEVADATEAAAAASAPQASVTPEAVESPGEPPVVPDQPEATTAPDVLAPSISGAAAAPQPQPPQPQPLQPRERRSAEAIDLLEVAGAPVGKRLAPVAAAVVIVLVWLTILRRRR